MVKVIMVKVRSGASRVGNVMLMRSVLVGLLALLAPELVHGESANQVDQASKLDNSTSPYVLINSVIFIGGTF